VWGRIMREGKGGEVREGQKILSPREKRRRNYYKDCGDKACEGDSTYTPNYEANLTEKKL